MLKKVIMFSSNIFILFYSRSPVLLHLSIWIHFEINKKKMSDAKSADSSRSESFSSIFKEKRNDINLFLTKYNDYFEASSIQETEIIERTAKMNQFLASYKSDLAKKLNDYNERLVEFQDFIDNFIKKKWTDFMTSLFVWLRK